MESMMGVIAIITDMSSILVKLLNVIFTKIILIFIHDKPPSLLSVAVLYLHFSNMIIPII